MNDPLFNDSLTAREPARRLSRPRAASRRGVTTDQDLSLHFLMSVIGQWWKILLPTILLLVGISSSLVWFCFEPQYKASAWLEIKNTQPFVAFPTEEPADREASKRFVHTQIELLRSPLILQRALAQPDVAAMPDLKRHHDPVDWLARKGLLINPIGDSQLLEIAYAGPDSQRAAQLVDAVINAYFSVRDEKSDAQIQSIIQLLENERSRRAEGIKVLQSEVGQLQAQLVQRDPTQAHQTMRATEVIISENPLKDVQQNLSKAEVDQKVLEAQVAAMRASLDTNPTIPDALVDREIMQRREIQETEATLNQKRAQLEQIAKRSAKAMTDPRYLRMKAEIEQLQVTLESLREVNRPQVRDQMVALALVSRQRELESLQTQLATQQLVVESMQTNYDSLVKELSLSGGQTLDLELKQRELARRQDVFDRISDRAAQLTTEMYAPRRVELIQDAVAPSVPMERIPRKLFLAAIAASTVVPLVACVAWERSVRRVTSIEQLQFEYPIPVVGEIARLPLRGAQLVQRADERDEELGLFEESVDSLRTGLVLSQEDRKIQVLAVTSAVSGEGKSSVAAQLAVSLARASGLPTLLIDGDMRAPDLHRIFQISLEPGLADVLAGTEPLGNCINRNWNDQVHILPAGRLTKSPHKLVGNARFAELLVWARQHYHFILIDTPPVLAASEAMVMATQADSALVCAMRDVSRESHVRMTIDRLMSVGAKPVGTVLSGVPTRQYARRYGAYAYATK